MSDDDLIRDHLRLELPSSAASTLDELLPTMRRKRRRRQAVLGVSASALIVACGAGALALRNEPRESIRMVNGPVADAPVTTAAQLRPAVTTAEQESAANSRNPVDTDVSTTSTTPSVTAPTAVANALPGPGVPATSGPAQNPSGGASNAAPAPVQPPSHDEPATSTTQPAIPTTAPSPVSPSTQTWSSACGTVTFAVDGSRLSIAATSPDAGFAVHVKDDGPESIELTLRNGDTSCEIHAEQHHGVLEVEIQNHH